MWAHHCEGRDLGPWAVRPQEGGALQVAWLAPGLVRVTAELRTRVQGRAGRGLGAAWHTTSVCLSAVPACPDAAPSLPGRVFKAGRFKED